MKKTLAIALLPLALGAVAMARAADQSAVTSETAASSPAPVTAQPVRKSLPRPGEHDCLRSTGSHIPPKAGHCLSVPGRSYSGKEIQRTGANNLGDALRMLDPSIH